MATRKPRAEGGREPHLFEPNARAALASIRRDRRLPYTDESLLQLAYTVGNGNPWDGYMTIKAATEQTFDGVRDFTAVLHKRLGLT